MKLRFLDILQAPHNALKCTLKVLFDLLRFEP